MNEVPETAKRWIRRVETLGGTVEIKGNLAIVLGDIIPHRLRIRLSELINEAIRRQRKSEMGK